MLTLFTNHPEAADPVIPIRWCVSPESTEILKRKKAAHPHLLLSIVYQGREVERKLVPLDQVMEYVEFRRPGPHRVLGAIVWPDRDSDISKLKEYFLRENAPYEYARRVLDYHAEEFYFYNFRSRYLPETAELAVVIADGFFPKEPPAWEQRWVNLWFETKAKDPCQIIKRRFLAYSIQHVAVLLWIVISVALRFLTALGAVLLCGMRGVDFGAILHPFRNEFKDVVENASCIFEVDKDGKKRPAAYLVFTPFIPLAIFFVLFLTPLSVIWDAVVTLILVGGISALIYVFSGRVRPESMMSQKEKEQKAAEEELNETLQLVACENTTPHATLKALPKSRRTLYLRFRDLKAKRCRPYAIK